MTALERVVKAVRAEMDAQEEFGTYQPERVARAALLAIREPDDAMMAAANAAEYSTSEDMDLTYVLEGRAPGESWKDSLSAIHAAMIDAILNETPE